MGFDRAEGGDCCQVFFLRQQRSVSIDLSLFANPLYKVNEVS